MWEFFSRPMLTLEQQIMMEGLVSHMRGAVEQWSDHHNSVYINLMIDSFFSLRLVQNLPLQDVVSLLLAAGCPESAPGGTLPRRRGSGETRHRGGKEVVFTLFTFVLLILNKTISGLL